MSRHVHVVQQLLLLLLQYEVKCGNLSADIYSKYMYEY